ncbi:MAG TPA: hypothetical protein VFU53_11375 [Burkholderiales bacterium]|nr:hypothetical protein [Burkholderiales bacterium]
MMSSGLPEALADQGVAAGAGNTATANLNFRVIIPPVTRLRIGDPAAISQIEFNLGAVGAPVPGDTNDVDDTNGGSGGYPTNATTAVTVQLFTTAANVDVSQTPASPTLQGSVLANTIPWTEILINDSGAGFIHSQSGGTLSNGTTTIFTGGPGTFNGTWTFRYDNTAAYAPDIYDGTMSYTVTNP